MNNLKRILSLALASVMLVGMMVVGASAADYPDADEIVNKDAVETLGALGIMNGDERGFRPQDGLTRAEAAKMLSKIHNKGVDVNFGVKDTPTFKDTDGHWAEGIIEYAAAFGIVNGMGNGIFAPQGELTVAQLARMVLNMMGYTEGQTGSDWELKTTVLANNMGLFDDLKDFLPTGKVNRDNAAQILVNAIDKPLANGNVTTEDVYTLTGKNNGTAITPMQFDSSTAAYLYASINKLTDIEVKKTTASSTESLATKYLSLKYKTGVVTASVKDTKTGTYNVTVKTASGDVTFKKLTSDYTDMLGRTVKVLYKSESAVYGINTADAVVATVDGGDYKSVCKPLDPNGYDTTGADVWTNGVYDIDGDTTVIKVGSIVELINNDADAQIDTIRVINKTVASLTADPKVVTSKDGKTTTVTINSTNYDSTKVAGYEDLKKGDVVLYVTINGVTTFEKADVVTGLVSGISKDKVYTVNGSKLYLSKLEGATEATTDFKTEYNFYLDNGGNIVAIAVAGEAVVTEQYAVVTDFGYIGKEDNSIGGQSNVTYQAQLLFTDGTYQVVEMVGYTTGNTVYGLKDVAAGDNTPAVTKFTTAIVVGTIPSQGTTATGGLKQNNVGRVVSYTVKDGKYTLKEVGATVAAGTLVGGKPNFISDNNTLAGNKNTTFLVKVGTGDKAKLNVYTGVAELPSSKDNGLTKGWAFTKPNTNFANLVYLEIEAIAGKTNTQTAYFLDKDAYVVTAKGYEVQAIVDGEIVTLVADEVATLTNAVGLKKVEYTDGKVTAINNLSSAEGFKTLNSVDMASEFVKDSTGKYYQLANDAVIYLLTSTKQTLVAPADLADTLDTTKYVYTAQVMVELTSQGTATDVIVEMYITMEKKPANP